MQSRPYVPDVYCVGPVDQTLLDGIASTLSSTEFAAQELPQKYINEPEELFLFLRTLTRKSYVCLDSALIACICSLNPLTPHLKFGFIDHDRQTGRRKLYNTDFGEITLAWEEPIFLTATVNG